MPWITGGLAEPTERAVLWAVALAIDLTANATGWAVPRLGHFPVAETPIPGGHLAERCRQVLIIALGEPALLIAVAFSRSNFSPASSWISPTQPVGLLLLAALTPLLVHMPPLLVALAATAVLVAIAVAKAPPDEARPPNGLRRFWRPQRLKHQVE